MGKLKQQNQDSRPKREIKMNEISPHTPCFLCSHIFEDTRPILYVSKADGDWQFLCGQDDHEGEIPHVVGISHIFERDKSLFAFGDLRDDYEANRDDIYSKWQIEPCTEKSEE